MEVSQETRKLVEMGYTPYQSRAALRQTGGRIEQVSDMGTV